MRGCPLIGLSMWGKFDDTGISAEEGGRVMRLQGQVLRTPGELSFWFVTSRLLGLLVIALTTSE